jgi:hypothetical protein
MRNLGLAFLALVVLFMGGCSLFVTLSAIADAGPYTGGILMFSLPLLALALWLSWLAWRGYRG